MPHVSRKAIFTLGRRAIGFFVPCQPAHEIGVWPGIDEARRVALLQYQVLDDV